MTAILRADQPAGAGSGTAGIARDDLWLARAINLVDTESVNNTIWRWEILDAPIGSTATLANPTTPAASFTPDVLGSYRLRLKTNGGGPGNEQVRILRVRYDNAGALQRRGYCLPAIGEGLTGLEESNYPGNTRGYEQPWYQIMLDVATNIGGGGSVDFASVSAALAAASASVAVNGQKITGLADPTLAQDAATKTWVETLVARGIAWKQAVRVASTTAIDLAAPGANIDDVAMNVNDRFLEKNHATQASRGLYVWNGAAVAATRATDADTSAEVTAGLAVYVAEGTANEDTAWVLTTDNPITLGVTSLTFVQFGAGGSGGAFVTDSTGTIGFLGSAGVLSTTGVTSATIEASNVATFFGVSGTDIGSGSSATGVAGNTIGLAAGGASATIDGDVAIVVATGDDFTVVQNGIVVFSNDGGTSRTTIDSDGGEVAIGKGAGNVDIGHSGAASVDITAGGQIEIQNTNDSSGLTLGAGTLMQASSADAHERQIGAGSARVTESISGANLSIVERGTDGNVGRTTLVEDAAVAVTIPGTLTETVTGVRVATAASQSIRAAGDIALRPTADSVDTLVCAVVSGECKLSSTKAIRIATTCNAILESNGASVILSVSGTAKSSHSSTTSLITNGTAVGMTCTGGNTTLTANSGTCLAIGFHIVERPNASGRWSVQTGGGVDRFWTQLLADVATTDATPTTLANLVPTARPETYELTTHAWDASLNVAKWSQEVTAVLRGGAAVIVVTGGGGAIADRAPDVGDAALVGVLCGWVTSTTNVRPTGTGLAATNLTWSTTPKGIK